MTDSLDTTPPAIDNAKLDDLGKRLFATWGIYATDRKMIEERWLRNLRQIRKIDDPEVARLIPKDRSKAYPGVTQWIARATVARLMQLLWPLTEKNYGVKASPLPDLSKDQLQQVLDQLVTAKAQGGDPAAVQLTDVEIEDAITAFAAGKAERMELKVTDDLQEMEFITLARKVVKSAVQYNMGIAVGPMHNKVPARKWQKNPFSGRWEAIEQEKLKPLFEHMSVWDHYMDMTAVSLERQDGTYDRHIMTRAEVEALADRPDFIRERVEKYLRDHTTGNYKAQWWESEIKGEPKSALSPVAGKETRKFEALSYRGPVTGHDLRAAGVEVSDADVGKTFHANAWMLDNEIIKLKLAPFGSEIRYHHYFVFEDDDLSICGNGQCDVVRDSQLSITEIARAILDNASVIGPMAEVNDDLLTPGQDVSIRKHKTWRREGEGAIAQYPAVRDISIESHLTELTAVLGVFMSFAEKESGLPPPSIGDVSGGGSEALRTTKNASMFLGAAALPIRDTVRNYDSFTVSVIKALVAWNKKYDPSDSRDGDHDVIARGSTSLIAKEVLSGTLNEFRASITDDERPHLNARKMLEMRMKANDLPTAELMEDEAKANATIAAQAQAAAQQLQTQNELVAAQVEEALSVAFKNAAQARAADSSISVEVFNSLRDGLAAGAKAHSDSVKAGAAAAKAAQPASTGAK